MKTCQLVLKPRKSSGDDAPLLCGAKATHLWVPRSRPDCAMPVCASHGGALAGNWRDELKPLEEVR